MDVISFIALTGVHSLTGGRLRCQVLTYKAAKNVYRRECGRTKQPGVSTEI